MKNKNSKFQFFFGISFETNKSECLECPAGYVCRDITTVALPSKCEAGEYCNAGSESASLCEIGTFSAMRGSSSADFCVGCLAGSFCDSEGMSSGIDCPAGHFCVPNMVWNPSGRVGYDCPAGHFCESGQTFGQPCPFGSYNPDTNAEEPGACSVCDPGSYCPEKAAIEPAGNCTSGYYCTGGNTDDRPTTAECSPGHECVQGSADEVECADGYYIPFDQAGECEICPAGYYCPRRPGDGILSRANGWPDKIICPENSYCVGGKSEPEKCPDGTTTTKGAVGLVKSSDCKPCPTGKFCRDGEVKGDCDRTSCEINF